MPLILSLRMMCWCFQLPVYDEEFRSGEKTIQMWIALNRNDYEPIELGDTLMLEGFDSPLFNLSEVKNAFKSKCHAVSKDE